MNQVEIAKKKLQIIRLRNLASWQRNDYAAGHMRQAAKPIYPKQEVVCMAKAAQAERLAAENEARANLMEAELDAQV